MELGHPDKAGVGERHWEVGVPVLELLDRINLPGEDEGHLEDPTAQKVEDRGGSAWTAP